MLNPKTVCLEKSFLHGKKVGDVIQMWGNDWKITANLWRFDQFQLELQS